MGEFDGDEVLALALLVSDEFVSGGFVACEQAAIVKAKMADKIEIAELRAEDFLHT